MSTELNEEKAAKLQKLLENPDYNDRAEQRKQLEAEEEARKQEALDKLKQEKEEKLEQ